MSRSLRAVLATVAALALAPIVAAQDPPNSVPPQGTVGIVVLLSDGMEYLPVGTAVIENMDCGPR